MPSGSHRGSSGSYSGGGASSSSSHSSSSSSSSSRAIYSRGGYYGHSRFYVLGGGGVPFLLISLFLFACIFVFIVGLVLETSAVEIIEDIQTDYAYYNNMISRAEKDKEYLTTGKITDIFFLEEADRWYFEYEFEVDSNSPYFSHFYKETVDGYIFAIFTFEQIQQFEVGQEIELATNSKTITSNTDSIPVLYKNYPIDASGEYLNAVNTRNTGSTMMAVSAVLFAVIITLGIILAKRKKKQQGSESSNTEPVGEVVKEETQKTHICAYCGSVVGNEDKKCPGCGARAVSSNFKK